MQNVVELFELHCRRQHGVGRVTPRSIGTLSEEGLRPKDIRSAPRPRRTRVRCHLSLQQSRSFAARLYWKITSSTSNPLRSSERCRDGEADHHDSSPVRPALSPLGGAVGRTPARGPSQRRCPIRRRASMPGRRGCPSTTGQAPPLEPDAGAKRARRRRTSPRRAVARAGGSRRRIADRSPPCPTLTALGLGCARGRAREPPRPLR